MTDLLALISVLIVMGIVLPAACRQYLADRAKFIGSLKAGAIYLAYCLIGIAFMPVITSSAHSESKVVAGMAFLLSWVVYGVLWLARLAPRYREVPAWIDKRNNVIDYGFWVVIGSTLLAALVG
jgi:hypothetical protein